MTPEELIKTIHMQFHVEKTIVKKRKRGKHAD